MKTPNLLRALEARLGPRVDVRIATETQNGEIYVEAYWVKAHETCAFAERFPADARVSEIVQAVRQRMKQ